ncbi:MAG: D-alanyl-D-alanine carboxypeptidase family protein [Acutalibacteraceae bacterium]
MKKKLFLMIYTAIFFIASLDITQAKAVGISVSAECAVLMCADNGEVLYEKNSDMKHAMASTTKILTSIIALEAAQYGNKQVKVTKDMYAEGSSMYLKEGEILTLKDLATGMMTVSGNDAANAVALSLANNFSDFAKIMNAKAKEIGMKNSSFVTPSGLDDDNHYSTAYDMALLMSYAMKNVDFAELTSKKSESVTFIKPEGKVCTYTNHNKLLRLYEYCVGGKTGFTESAGRCLVSCAKKDGVTLVAVTLNAPDDWNDHINMYEYGFPMMQSVELDDFSESFSVNIVGGETDNIFAVAENSSQAIVKKSDINMIERKVMLADFVYAPVTAGDRIGVITYKYNGDIIAENYLVAETSVKYVEVKKSFFQKLVDFISSIF